MSNKNIIFIIIGIIVIAVLVYFVGPMVWGPRTYGPQVEEGALSQKDFQKLIISDARLSELIQNSSVSIPETSFNANLNNGWGTFSDETVRGTVHVEPILAKISAGEEYDTFAAMTVDMGGSGTFYYLALFRINTKSVSHTSSIFLGDRIKVQSVTLGEMEEGSYVATVRYLDRPDNASFFDPPTQERERALTVSDHLFISQ